MDSESNHQCPILGLVCITASNEVRFKTTTRKRLLQLPIPEQERVLRQLYAENLRRLGIAIEFCDQENIRLYRMISGLFPFADDTIGEAILSEFAAELQAIGQRAKTLEIRLVFHPDQFVVLNSDRPEVIENSIKILNTHARIMDLLELPRSPWALMNIHGGKGGRAERLIQVIRDLPEAVRSRLTLENDEYTYRAVDLVEICKAAGIPLVFDAHHHIIHEHLDTYEDSSVLEMLEAARTTWAVPDWQLVHISNGNRSFNDSHHSDYITIMPSSYRQVGWIEVEAKLKEQAIKKLREEWLYGAPDAMVYLSPAEQSTDTELLPVREQEIAQFSGLKAK
ncbi:MAG TPA: UV DNA damage repair endonuclease UvsE [Trichocoleus sp.]|jgi:UV DNA damage endonuclease